MEVRALDLYSARQPMENVGAWLREMAADDAEPVLLGYSMGGRLALEALVEDSSAWAAAVIVSAQPGLADPGGAPEQARVGWQLGGDAGKGRARVGEFSDGLGSAASFGGAREAFGKTGMAGRAGRRVRRMVTGAAARFTTDVWKGGDTGLVGDGGGGSQIYKSGGGGL